MTDLKWNRLPDLLGLSIDASIGYINDILDVDGDLDNKRSHVHDPVALSLSLSRQIFQQPCLMLLRVPRLECLAYIKLVTVLWLPTATFGTEV